MLRVGAIGLLVLAMGGPDLAGAQSIRTVPVDHWSYDVADELVLRHPELSETVWTASRPWREEAFRALVERALDLDLDARRGRVGRWVEMLASEYAALEGRFGDLPIDFYNAFSLGYRGAFREDDVTFDPAFAGVRFDVSDGEPENRVIGRHDAALAYRDRVGFVWSWVVDQNVRNDPTRQRLAVERFRDVGSDDEFGIVVLDAYGAVEAGPVLARIGRAVTSLGPGRGASVFLSDSTVPIDQIRVEVDVVDPVRLTGIVGRLGGEERNRELDEDGAVVPGSVPAAGFLERVQRNVYLHRLDARWGPWLQVAVSEAVVSSGIDRGIEAGFASMVLPFAAFDDDARRSFLWDAEVVAAPVAGLRLYGHLVTQAGEETDDRRAWRGGGRWAPPGVAGVSLGAEYTRTDRLVYVDSGLNTGWTTFGVPLGSMLGPDADEAHGWIEYWATPNVRVTADALRRRRGEGGLAGPVDFGEGSGDTPSGTVERQWRYGIDASWISPWTGLEAGARLDYRTVENLANEVGRDDGYWEFRVDARWRWDARLR